MSTLKSSNDHLTLNADGTSKDIKFQADGTEKMVLKSDGNVGIGTNTIANESDHKKLVISGGSGTGAGMIEFADTSNNIDAAIFADGGNLFIVADRDGATADSSIRFRVDGSSEKLRIDSSGVITNNSGVYKIGTLTEASNSSGFNFDSTGATSISLTQNTAVAITTNLNASGMLLVNDTSCSGQTALMVTGGGVISIVGATSGVYIIGSSPNTGQIGFYVSSGKIYVKNGQGCTASLNMQTFRTRTGQ